MGPVEQNFDSLPYFYTYPAFSSENNVLIESTPKLTHVCPEQYQGTLSGYPLYKSGYVTQENCDQDKPKFDASKIGVKVRNMKMDFNTGGTWRQVGQ